LYFRHDTFKSVILTVGLFGLILFGVCVWFSFHKPRSPASGGAV
jgi:hypothetical protein